MTAIGPKEHKEYTDVDRLAVVFKYLQYTLQSEPQNREGLIHLLASKIQIEMISDANYPTYKGRRKRLEIIDPIFSSSANIAIIRLKVFCKNEGHPGVLMFSNIINEHKQSIFVADQIFFLFKDVKTALKICRIVHTRKIVPPIEPSTKSIASSSSSSQQEISPKNVMAFITSNKIKEVSLATSYEDLKLPFRYSLAYLKDRLSSMEKLLSEETQIYFSTVSEKYEAPKTVGRKEFKDSMVQFRNPVPQYFEPNATIKNIKIEFIYKQNNDPIILQIKCIRGLHKEQDIQDSQCLFFRLQDNKIDRLGHVQHQPYKPSLGTKGKKLFLSFIGR